MNVSLQMPTPAKRLKQQRLLDKQKKAKRRLKFIYASEVRKFLLDFAAENKAHKFTRVSAKTLERIDAELRFKLETLVRGLPSKGKTI
jgi:hypothetical protein